MTTSDVLRHGPMVPTEDPFKVVGRALGACSHTSSHPPTRCRAYGSHRVSQTWRLRPDEGSHLPEATANKRWAGIQTRL